MHLLSVSFDGAVDLVQGFDAAMHRGLLRGFHEWLTVALGEMDCAAWPAQVRELLRRTRPEIVDEAELIDALFETIEGFLARRDAPYGMRRIYANYEAWLRAQEWYGPASPNWIVGNSTGDGSSGDPDGGVADRG